MSTFIDRAIGWLEDNLLVVGCVFGATAIGAAIWFAVASSDHTPCVKYGQVYVPPTYIKSGNVLIPVGGGMERRCVLHEDEVSR